MTVTLHITEKARIFIYMPGRQHTSKSLAAVTATVFAAANHMLFCLPGFHSEDKAHGQKD